MSRLPCPPPAADQPIRPLQVGHPLAHLRAGLGGTVAAARYTGHSWRDSTSLGLLMNTRGAVGLVVLNIGLDLKILTPTVFAMMVLMAVTTTFATPPLLRWVLRRPAA